MFLKLFLQYPLLLEHLSLCNHKGSKASEIHGQQHLLVPKGTKVTNECFKDPRESNFVP